MSKALGGMNYVDGETRIVLIGKTGIGKSSTANTLLGMKHFQSLASSVSITNKTSSKKTEYEGRDLLVIDTPGLFDTGATNQSMMNEILKCVALASPGLHAVVLVTKIARFTEEEQKTVQEFMEYFGAELRQYLIVVFTGKDDLDDNDSNLEDYLRTAQPVLKKTLEDCSYRCIALNNRAGKEEKIKFKRNFFRLVDDNVRRNGGKCYTNDMLKHAEMLMKQAEDRKLAELKEEKRKEREIIERKMRAEQEREKIQKWEEEKRRYHLELQEEARKRARQDVEEDKSSLDKFVSALVKPFKWLVDKLFLR